MRPLQVERSRDDKAAATAAEGDNAKSALAAMEARLSDLRKECRELQVSQSTIVLFFGWLWSREETAKVIAHYSGDPTTVRRPHMLGSLAHVDSRSQTTGPA